MSRGDGTRGGGRSWSLGSRIAPPRFVGFLAVFVVLAFAWLQFRQGALADAVAIGFDGATVLFLLSLIPLLRAHRPEDIRRHAHDNDANRVLVLVITCVFVLVVLGAVSGELPDAAKGEPWAIARLLATLALAWLFGAASFAVHYAHLYYSASPGRRGQDSKGLDFPGGQEPDYGDFFYFSATLAMTFQTSDVAITGRTTRRVVLVQCLAAFVYNLGVVAFVINGLGGLAG